VDDATAEPVLMLGPLVVLEANVSVKNVVWALAVNEAAPSRSAINPICFLCFMGFCFWVLLFLMNPIGCFEGR
jgi:hypothetical protein